MWKLEYKDESFSLEPDQALPMWNDDKSKATLMLSKTGLYHLTVDGTIVFQDQELVPGKNEIFGCVLTTCEASQPKLSREEIRKKQMDKLMKASLTRKGGCGCRKVK